MKILLMCLALFAFSASAATAATLKAVVNEPGVNNFLIEFSDNNGNGMLDFSEVTSFSGVTYFGIVYDLLRAIPKIDGVMVAGTDFGPTAGDCCFLIGTTSAAGSFLTAGPTAWTYSVVLSPVPLPASMPLALGAIGTLAFLRRRCKPV